MIGTTGDPDTPYRDAVALSRILDNARLLTFRAEGHAAFNRSQCVATAVTAYLSTTASAAARRVVRRRARTSANHGSSNTDNPADERPQASTKAPNHWADPNQVRNRGPPGSGALVGVPHDHRCAGHVAQLSRAQRRCTVEVLLGHRGPTAARDRSGCYSSGNPCLSTSSAWWLASDAAHLDDLCNRHRYVTVRLLAARQLGQLWRRGRPARDRQRPKDALSQPLGVRSAPPSNGLIGPVGRCHLSSIMSSQVSTVDRRATAQPCTHVAQRSAPVRDRFHPPRHAGSGEVCHELTVCGAAIADGLSSENDVERPVTVALVPNEGHQFGDRCGLLGQRNREQQRMDTVVARSPTKRSAMLWPFTPHPDRDVALRRRRQHLRRP